MSSHTKYIELLQLSFEALTERKFRAFMTILMVIIGSGLIVAVNGISTGTVAYIDSQFQNLGANLLIISPRGSDTKLDQYFIDDVKKMDGVLDVIPFYQQAVSIESHGEKQTIIVMGIEQSKLHLIFPTIAVKEGHLVSQSDSIGILLGHELAYGRSEEEPFATVGRTVKITYVRTVEGEQVIYEKSFIVRGVLEYIGSGIIPIDQMAFISLKSADDFFEREGVYDGVYVVTKDIKYNDEVMEKIHDKYNVNIISPKSIIDVINKISGAVTFFTNNIAVVSLLVAAVGIITTLWTSVLERIREIGILKSIGFNNTHILILFLNEALIIGAVGGVIGVGFGIFLAHALRFMFSSDIAEYVKPLFTVESIVSTWVLSVVISAIAGLYPSWRASKLDPVIALRYE